MSEATQDSSIATHIAQCLSCQKVLSAAQRVLTEESDLQQGVVPELYSSINAYYGVDATGETVGTMLDKQPGTQLKPAGFVFSILGALVLIFLAKMFGLQV